MKIAYLILAHNDSPKLKRLIEALSIDNTGFFIHIDKKVDIQPFLKECKDFDNVSFVENRICINWAGYSMCLAEKELIKTALKCGIYYERFVLLSGLDYPLWSNRRINQEFENNETKEYMMAYNLSLVKEPKKIPQRVTTYHFRDISLPSRIATRFIVGLLMRLMNILPIKKKVYISCRGGKMNVYGGAQWFALTRACIEYVYEQLESNNKLCQYFKTSFAPDELLLQTIVFNSNFKKNAICFEENGIYPGLEQTTCTHYISYKGGQKVFTETDFGVLLSSNKVFCRKVVTGVSDKLMDMIDKYREENN